LWRRLLRLIREFFEEEKPAAFVPIDFYGFNHQVLGLARHRNIPSYYYISPQVWASRPGRVQNLKRLIRHMMVIFPFEAEIYTRSGVPCTFVGHPLMELLPETEDGLSLNGGEIRVGLLPGSRPSEIQKHLPMVLGAFTKIREKFPQAKGHLFVPPNLPDSFFETRLRDADGIRLVRDAGYQVRKSLHLALTASGTATLENALLGIPMAVFYRLPWLSYHIAKRIIRVPFISMANILSGRAVVPELIQEKATPQNLAREALRFLENPELWKETRESLLKTRALLGNSRASERAADLILEQINA